jgi:hypothetical protein
MLLNRHQLPVIGESDLTTIPVAVESKGFDISSNFGNDLDLGDIADVIEAELG